MGCDNSALIPLKIKIKHNKVTPGLVVKANNGDIDVGCRFEPQPHLKSRWHFQRCHDHLKCDLESWSWGEGKDMNLGCGLKPPVPSN